LLPFEDRYTRQRQLAEVGRSGQEKLAALVVRTTDDREGRVAYVYLRRAGVVELSLDSSAQRPSFRHSSHFRFAAARAFAEGTHQALQQLRAGLGLIRNA
jgi:hypothetical protein